MSSLRSFAAFLWRRVSDASLLWTYAGEMAWREDNRRKPNGTQFMNAVGTALGHPLSRQWARYWQRAA
jgi:hypothetical protein